MSSEISRERGFLEYERQDVAYRPVAERIKDYQAVDLPLSEAEIRVQAARCMDCGTPFCHAAPSGCPLRNVIPEFNEQVYFGRWKEALDLLLHTNPFPEVTGRVCPAPCEGACVLGTILPPVNICKIELAIVEQGFQRGYLKTERRRQRRPESVAVVGSGPAGLAAACRLNRAGCNVTVYEKDARPGGLLRYGIPDFKLEKWVVDQRIDLMRQEGVVFECGVNIGEDLSYRFLRQRFDALVLATGAGVPRDLQVSGRELEGIHFAMEYLGQQNRVVGGEPLNGARITATGKRVVVIGGGDTGSDCIGTAWRQGAREVTQLEILPKPPATRSESTPWPLWPLMLRESSSHQEGGTRRWSVDTTGFAGDGGRVQQVQCTEVEWVMDETLGRVCPRPVPGSAFTLDADLVLLALGFIGPGRTALIEQLHLATDQRGFIARDGRHMTSTEGVLVAGDMHQGPSLVVRAIADGLKTGEAVLNYLNTEG